MPPVSSSMTIVVEALNIDIFASETKLQESPEEGNVTIRRNRGHHVREVVPDSEEDRIPQHHSQQKEVIVISSGSEGEDEDEVEAILNSVSPKAILSGGWASEPSEDDGQEETPAKRLFKTPMSGRRFPAARRIIESSESECSEPELGSPVKPVKKKTAREPTKKSVVEEVMELTSSSEDDREPGPSKQSPTNPIITSPDKSPSYLTQEDDGAILVFDEPKSARKPMLVGTPRQRPPKQLRNTTSTKKTKVPAPNEDKTLGLRGSPSINSSTVSVKSTTRVSKKAIEEAEQVRREKYAQNLFDELNTLVFKNGLPQKTKLNWNKRLLTTAGRAKYRRSRDGVETAEIELATKILDCDERIRNTLSHEMCHLATWVIDKKLDENHGRLFKHWASKVTRKRSDIEITTRHDYEISYPYKWECQKCQKIYGRYSNSIRPDECVCGACREGRLIPLFTVRSKAQTPKISRLAAGKSQDSPRSLPPKLPSEPLHIGDIPCADTDIEALTLRMDATHIL